MLSPQLKFCAFDVKLIHSSRPKTASDKVFEDLIENVRKLEIISLLRCDAQQALSFIQREISGSLVDLCPIQVLGVGVGIASATEIFTNEVPLLQVKSQFFFNFPNQRLLGFLAFLDVTTEKNPNDSEKECRAYRRADRSAIAHDDRRGGLVQSSSSGNAVSFLRQVGRLHAMPSHDCKFLFATWS